MSGSELTKMLRPELIRHLLYLFGGAALGLDPTVLNVFAFPSLLHLPPPILARQLQRADDRDTGLPVSGRLAAAHRARSPHAE